MSVFFTNPHRFLASFMTSESFSASIKSERRYLEGNTHFHPSTMREMHSQLSLHQRVKYVKKLPREGSVIRQGITFKTHYEEISMPSNLYLIDDVLVVFLSENDPSKKKPMGRFDALVFESKNPLGIVKNNFYHSNVSSLITLSLIAGVSSGAGLALFLSQGGSVKKIQEVVQYALAGIAILGWWRLFQWSLCMNKLSRMRHEGDWAAQLRAYAYSYPSVLNERAIQRFLLENEVQYLQGCAPSIFQRLKNNLSL